VVRSQGFFSVKSACPACRGTGQVIKDPCPQCRGLKRIIVNKKVSLKIPAGVDNGSKLRLTGEGEPGTRGGPNGDLYVFLSVKPHEFFKRNGTDVICSVELSFVQAALGGEITVPTLTGEETLKIPKGTQYADTFRLHGQGIPSIRSNARGDQIIQVDLKTPKNMNKKQEELLKEFMQLDESKLTKKIKRLFKGGTAKAAK
jgi:molecular chaperone DnaJ